MYFVEFPKLNLGFNINPVAFSIGNFNIYWYGIIISIAFLVSFLYAILNVKRFKIDQDKFIDCVIVGLIAGIIGARLFYVLFYPGDTYIKNPISVFYLHEGGLAIYGGIICGLLGGGLMARHKKLNVLACLDVASISFLIGQSIGRWGNFINQEAFGGPTDLPWGMVSRNTAYVSSGPVHPCFLYESIWCIIGFFILNWFSKKYRKYDGEMFLMYMVWYGIGRCFIEQLRSDSLLIPMTSLPISQVISILCVIIGLALLIYFYAMQNPESKLGQWLSKFTSKKDNSEIQIKEKESQENIDIENKLLEDEPTVESKPESTNVESKETNDEKSSAEKESAKKTSESAPKEISDEKPATKKRTTKRASSTKSESKEVYDEKPTTKKRTTTKNTSSDKSEPKETSDEKPVTKKRTTKKASSTKSEPKETSDENPTTKKRTTTQKASSDKSESKETSDEKPATKKKTTTKKASTAKANPEESSDEKPVTKKRTTKRASSTKSESKETPDEQPATKKKATTKKASTAKAVDKEASDEKTVTKKRTTTKKASATKAEPKEVSTEKPDTKKKTTKRASSTSSKSTIDKKENDSQQDSKNSQQK